MSKEHSKDSKTELCTFPEADESVDLKPGGEEVKISNGGWLQNSSESDGSSEENYDDSDSCEGSFQDYINGKGLNTNFKVGIGEKTVYLNRQRKNSRRKKRRLRTSYQDPEYGDLDPYPDVGISDDFLEATQNPRFILGAIILTVCVLFFVALVVKHKPRT